jgi:hypothetical protein
MRRFYADGAVSSIIGTILLVGITVILVSTLSVYVFNNYSDVREKPQAGVEISDSKTNLDVNFQHPGNVDFLVISGFENYNSNSGEYIYMNWSRDTSYSFDKSQISNDRIVIIGVIGSIEEVSDSPRNVKGEDVLVGKNLDGNERVIKIYEIYQ